MLQRHLRARGIRDERILEAFGRVPRERFVPPESAREAYADRALPIGFGQTVSQPYVIAFMAQALELAPTDKLLEIGTGSGYPTAILAQLVPVVWTIEIVEPLALRAQAVLAELGITNVRARIGDGYGGWPEQAPFDAIVVTAAPDHVPEPLAEQLALGGRLVLPKGQAEGGRRQHLLRIRRTAQGFAEESLLPVAFVPMTGAAERRERDEG